MKKLFDEIGKDLPLKITFCEVEDYFISFGSDNWNFYSDSNWRIIKESKVICSDDDIDVGQLSQILLNCEIIAVKPLSDNLLEPIFLLSNSFEFQVFSKTNDEPWKLTLPSIVYVPYN